MGVHVCVLALRAAAFPAHLAMDRGAGGASCSLRERVLHRYHCGMVPPSDPSAALVAWRKPTRHRVQLLLVRRTERVAENTPDLVIMLSVDVLVVR